MTPARFLAGLRRVPLVMLVGLSAACAWMETKAPVTNELQPFSLGGVERCQTYGGIFLASQPQPDDLRIAKETGIRTVINLRTDEELDWDEAGTVDSLGMTYHQVPFRSPEQMTDAVLDRLRGLLSDPANRPVLLHCASANRVGAVWLAHRTADDGLAWGPALVEARLVGLRTPALEERVKEYLR